MLLGFDDLLTLELFISLLCGSTTTSLLDAWSNRDIRLLLATDIIDNGLEGVGHGVPAFPQWVHHDCETRAEHPKDADDDPTAEERFAEDVAGSVPGKNMSAFKLDRKSHGPIRT